MEKKVLVLMGSASDLPTVEKALGILEEFGIGVERHISSAHRSPAKTVDLVTNAKARGFKLILCAAGKAAHLAGVSAAHTTLPVFGLPMATSVAGGLDSLLSTVQMPSGTPVATFGTGDAGAFNAGLFAVKVLALSDAALQEKLEAYTQKLADDVEVADKKIQ